MKNIKDNIGLVIILVAIFLWLNVKGMYPDTPDWCGFLYLVCSFILSVAVDWKLNSDRYVQTCIEPDEDTANDQPK